MQFNHRALIGVAGAALLAALTPGVARPAQGQLQPSQGAGATPFTATPALPTALPEAALQAADALLRRGETSKAEQVARQFLREHPHSADAHFLLGLILFREQKAKESLAEYTAGSKERRPSAYELKIVALDYGILKAFQDADKWLSMSLEWDPNDSEGWYYLGRIRYNANHFDAAITAFQKCLALDPGNVKAEDNMGLAYEGKGDAEGALALYRKAIDRQAEASAKDPGPWINAGSLLVEKDRAQEAIPLLKKAIEIAPNEFKSHQQLGKAYQRLDQMAQAQAELEQAIALSPNNAPLHFVLGQIYRRLGMTEKANAEFSRFSALNGSHSTENAPKR